MSHTPGPWKRLDSDSRRRTANAAKDVDEALATAKANYRVALAAPDMLAALEEVRNIAQMRAGNPFDQPWFNRMDAAIAKARGA